MTDTMLLREYLDAGSEEAFAEIVHRHTDWVYHAALRMVRDSHLAEDVTQAVFIVLAKNAQKVGHKPLNAWLFGVMRYSAIHAMRSLKRQQWQEYQAAEMAAQNAGSRQSETWEELAGRLEESVWRLGRQERQAVLLRFYQQKSLAEVGAALGVSEDAARKRVAKAVGQLRKMLGAAEIIGSAELLETLLQRITHPAPTSVKVTCVSAHGTTASGATVIAKGAMTMMLLTKLKIAAAVLIVLALIPCAVGVVMATRKSPSVQPAVTTRPAISQMALVLRIKAASNLRQIGQALLLYSNENLAAFPPTLGDLIRTESISPQVFLLPESPKHPPMNLSREQRARWVNANTDFVYFGFGKTSYAASSDILVAQKIPVPGDRARNLLFAYGSTAAFPLELAKQLIAENSEPMIVEAKIVPRPEGQQDQLLAREQQIERLQCAGNLRRIWQMILLYRYNHAGQYPPNLDALQIGPRGSPPYDFKALQHLGENIDESCPSARSARIADFRKMEPAPALPPRWIYDQDDYIYAADKPQPGASEATSIIAYDKDENHGDGVNILFGDGHVRWYSLAQVHDLIQQNGSPSHP